jgi:hypothetical protein
MQNIQHISKEGASPIFRFIKRTGREFVPTNVIPFKHLYSFAFILSSLYHRRGSLLTHKEVIEIFRFKDVAASEKTKVAAALAHIYGLTPKSIRDIWAGRSWGELTSHIDNTVLKGFATKCPPTAIDKVSALPISPPRALSTDDSTSTPPTADDALSEDCIMLERVERPFSECIQDIHFDLASPTLQYMQDTALRVPHRHILLANTMLKRIWTSGFRLGQIASMFDALPVTIYSAMERAFAALMQRPPPPAATTAAAGVDLLEETLCAGAMRLEFSPATQQRSRIHVTPAWACIFGMHGEELLSRMAAHDLRLPMPELDFLVLVLYDLLHAASPAGAARYMRFAAGPRGDPRGVLVFWTTVIGPSQVFHVSRARARTHTHTRYTYTCQYTDPSSLSLSLSLYIYIYIHIYIYIYIYICRRTPWLLSLPATPW